MFSTTSTTKVNFSKNMFYPGETLKINIDCDNTKCARNVKSFKIKLQRKWVGFTD